MGTFIRPPSDGNTIVRASGVLPAAGAYDSSPASIAVENAQELVFLIAYTRGAAGGAVTAKVEFSDDNVTWFQSGHLNAPVFAAGSDSVFGLQRAEVKYQATGAAQELFLTPSFTVAARWCRISLKESGAVGTPGTASVRVQLRGSY